MGLESEKSLEKSNVAPKTKLLTKNIDRLSLGAENKRKKTPIENHEKLDTVSPRTDSATVVSDGTHKVSTLKHGVPLAAPLGGAILNKRTKNHPYDKHNVTPVELVPLVDNVVGMVASLLTTHDWRKQRRTYRRRVHYSPIDILRRTLMLTKTL